MVNIREWVNAEISKKTKGRSLSKKEIIKIYKNTWKQAKREFEY